MVVNANNFPRAVRRFCRDSCCQRRYFKISYLAVRFAPVFRSHAATQQITTPHYRIIYKMSYSKSVDVSVKFNVYQINFCEVNIVTVKQTARSIKVDLQTLIKWFNSLFGNRTLDVLLGMFYQVLRHWCLIFLDNKQVLGWHGSEE